MAKVKLVGERLDPPMTAKERSAIRRVKTALLAGVGLAYEARDPGIAGMAEEITIIFDESVNRLVQAYRDAKAEY